MTIDLDNMLHLSEIVRNIADRFRCTSSEAIAYLERLSMKDDARTSIREFVRTEKKFRLLRNDRLDAPIFRDPAWDMLLDLIVAEQDHERLSVSALCLGSGVAATTALRHIERLMKHGFVTREEDRKDDRRVFVDLVPAKRDALLKFLSEWQQAEIPAAGPAARSPRSERGHEPAHRRSARTVSQTPHSVFLS